jgi:hypothetical protein
MRVRVRVKVRVTVRVTDGEAHADLGHRDGVRVWVGVRGRGRGS